MFREKEYQVNISTNAGLERLKVTATTEKKAIALADRTYKDYVKAGYLKWFKILSIFKAN